MCSEQGGWYGQDQPPTIWVCWLLVIIAALQDALENRDVATEVQTAIEMRRCRTL